MDSDQNFLRLSPLTSTSSTASQTQAPTSVETQLGGCISLEIAKRLRDKYNRKLIPIMGDDEFFDILVEVATKFSPESIEAQLQCHLHSNDQVTDAYEAAKHEMWMPGLDWFEEDSLKLLFTAGLSLGSFRGIQRFLTHCVPHLINLLNHKTESNLSNRVSKPKRKKEPKFTQSGPRRNTRIAPQGDTRIPPRRDTRIAPRRSTRVSRKPVRWDG